MFPFKHSLFVLSSLLLASSASAADGGVSPYPYILFEVPITEGFSFPVTNSMVTTWFFSIAIILIIRLLMGKLSLIPSRKQALVEGLLEGVKGLIEPIVGKKMVRPTLPLLIAFFTFILIMNWSGLLPGVGSFGHIKADGSFHYYFRPANADLNTTLGLAIVSFIAWIYFIMRYAGIKLVAYDLFGNKADKAEVPIVIYFGLFGVFFAVGLIEVVSILSRLVSLPFRLYGNVFGGENLLTSMHGLVGWIVPVPFFFLELLIGLVQALVFTLLVAVYIGLICNHDSEDHEKGHAH